MRKLSGKIHLWLSLPIGIIISIICFSGAILVFEKEVARWSNPHLYKVDYQEGSMPLTPSALYKEVQKQIPDSLILDAIQWSSSQEEACTMTFKNAGRKTLSVNPYTGEVLGWIKGSAFFSTVKKLHRYLLDAPEKKGMMSAGKWLVGTSTLLMAVILITGFIIWIPKTRKALKNRLQVSCGKGKRRFWYDTHVSLGFYATLFLLVMALTGLFWSFKWYRNTAYAFTGKPSKGIEARMPKAPSIATWDALWNEVKKQYPDFQNIKMSHRKVEVIRKACISRQTDTYVWSSETGKVKEIVRYEDIPQSDKLKGWFYAFHTGSWGGLTTKILYFLAALIGGTLPLTGYYLWLKKKKKH